MPKGDEETRSRGLFGTPAKGGGKRQTVRERRIGKAHAKRPIDMRVRENIAVSSPKTRLAARETARSIRNTLFPRKKR